MHVALLLIACLLALDNGFRIRTSAPTKSICRIEENPDGATYGISFGVALGDCGEMHNCNFWVLKDVIAPMFIDEPIKSNQKAKLGTCSCYPHMPPEQEDVGAMVHYIYTPQEPCDQQNCWLKYNQFVSLVAAKSDPNKNYRNQSRNGNHWKIGCDDGSPSLDGLKTYKQLLGLLPSQEQTQLGKLARREGIVPESPKRTKKSKPASPRSGSKDNAENNSALLTSSGTGQEVAIKLQEKESVVHENKNTDEMVSELGTMPSMEVAEGIDEEESQMREEFRLKLRNSIDLLERIEVKIVKMMAKTEDFKSICKLMKDGKVEEAKAQDLSPILDYLRGNIIALAQKLLENVDSSYAFEYAALLTSMSVSKLDQLLEDLVETIRLQGDASNDLVHLQGQLLSAAQAFVEANDGDIAYGTADFMMKTFQTMKFKVSESMYKLKAIDESFD